MAHDFFADPILNSPYEYPSRHWELDGGQPTGRVLDIRRPCQLITPIPQPKKNHRGKHDNAQVSLDIGVEYLTHEEQQYDPAPIINEIRDYVDRWRRVPVDQWNVTPETRRLLEHWRSLSLEEFRPFFCQIEAVETAIWLHEVAPQNPTTRKFRAHLEAANESANPDLFRVALKLATGAGKTTVMAMLIAWQTVNALRHRGSKRFSHRFLIVTPGITIRDRLRVLLPNDPENYYERRQLVPADMLPAIRQARVVITNYHAFRRRERVQLAKGTRQVLQGRNPEPVETVETEGQMLQRVVGELMGGGPVVALNDEGHHCYRERPQSEKLTGEERKEAEKNNEAARLWITGLETVKRHLGLVAVYDLSATPFFLRGSGYAEGTLFPWTVSDFSLMDAIECGIVKLPRVPVADNVPSGDMPKLRNLWEHIRDRMPRKGRKKGGAALDPLSLPPELQTALYALYSHYEKTFEAWREQGITVPPVFIVVCNNTATSKLVYDWIVGFHREKEDGTGNFEQGRLELFRNFDEEGNRLPYPRTILVDSEQLDSEEALLPDFREVAADEIERFKHEIRRRTGDLSAADKLSDADILREVMNTVGKRGRLGEQVRCVVSVSMLTEGWDCNTVTHILGVRAFGTQLLCEQVVGRALRRYSYEPQEDGRFAVEYADILGVPFDFTAKPVVAPPKPPKPVTVVRAVSPDRDACEIEFPRVRGYRVELPEERLEARFEPDHTFELTPEIVGPSITHNRGIVGEGEDLRPETLEQVRRQTVAYHLARHLLLTHFREPDEPPKAHLFGQLLRIVQRWLDGGHLRCRGQTFEAQALYLDVAGRICERIYAGIVRTSGQRRLKAVLDPYNPKGSTRFVNFRTSKQSLWETDLRKCHVNCVVCDSDWEAEFCRVVESHPRVLAYVKNHNLGFEVPYRVGSTVHWYRPDFILRIDDGRPDPLHLVVEVKGFRNEDAKEKKQAMESYWIPGVNNLGRLGRWAFAEFRSLFDMSDQFDRLVRQFVNVAA